MSIFIPVSAQSNKSGTIDTSGSPPGGGYEGPSTIPSDKTVEYTINPQAFLSVSPSPIGVGQQALVNLWITFPSGEGKYMTGYKVVITDPDGSTQTVNLKSYVASGTCWFSYTPLKVGNYTLKFYFAGEFFPEGYYTNGKHSETRTGDFRSAIYNPAVYCSPAESREVTLIVQEDLVWGVWQNTPSNDYWTHPVEPNNRNSWDALGHYPWGQANVVGVSSNAWTDNYYGPYIPAVTTPHIVWKRQSNVAGLIGGEGFTFSTLSSPGTPNVIYMGRAYQTRNELIDGVPTSCAVCYDLRTGELYYARPIAQGGITPTHISYFDPNESSIVPGAVADVALTPELSTISGGRLYKVNPTTGAITANISISTVIGTGNGSNNEIAFRDGYYYSFQGLESIMDNPAPDVSFASAYVGNLIKWSSQGTSTNFTSRIESNVSMTLPRSYRTAYGVSDYGNVLAAVDWDSMISVQQHRFIYGGYYGYRLEALDLETGKILWEYQSSKDEMSSAYRPTNVWVRDGKYMAQMELGSIKAWDLKNGKELWTYKVDDWPWGIFWMYDEAAYQDLIYAVGYTGIHAINQTTGELAWQHWDPAPPFETPYVTEGESSYTVQDIRVIGGLLYVSNNEHTPSQPPQRGWGMMCLDAITGEVQWKLSGTRMQAGAAAYGYLTAASNYDGTMYVLGKSPSKTSLSGPQIGISKGNSVVLTGSVLDQAPASLALDPAGIACVSDESMDTWMDYKYLQMPIGGFYNNETIVGVPVSIDAMNQNGEWIHVGETYTDTTGSFSYVWIPDDANPYYVTATFAGSNAYGSSWASTTIGVSAAPEVVDNTVTIPPIGLYIAISTVIIVVAVLLIGILLLLKKKQ
ncbi:MAG: PQQ-binding-like beta-propeller repeat protein [Candidatus Bathyarchaeota archaeon]|nr:PQQ-binding-like beta-propeller repeat protein [Candidatus Termiticorpusculum sp.]